MSTNLPTVEAALSRPGARMIAIHLGVPERPIHVRAYGMDSPLAFASVLDGLHCFLRHAISGDLPFGGWGDLANALFYFIADNHAHAAGLAMEYLESTPGLSAYAEIAWCDDAEGYWRTIYPAKDALPFERWKTEEQERDRKLRMAGQETLLQSLTQEMNQITAQLRK